MFQLYANRDPVEQHTTFPEAEDAAREKYGNIEWSGFRGPHLWVGYIGDLEIEIRKAPTELVER